MSSVQIRPMAEFTLPAMAPGAFIGVLGSALAAVSGLPTAWAVAAGVTLGVSLMIAGAVHAGLLVTRKIPSATFLFTALYWLVVFPVAFLLYAIVTGWAVTGRPGLPEDVVGFLTFKAVLSTGFAFGFMWIQEQIGMYWWPRIRDHNIYAAAMVEMYKSQSVALQRRKRPRKPRNQSGRAGRGAQRKVGSAAGR